MIKKNSTVSRKTYSSLTREIRQENKQPNTAAQSLPKCNVLTILRANFPSSLSRIVARLSSIESPNNQQVFHHALNQPNIFALKP